MLKKISKFFNASKQPLCAATTTAATTYYSTHTTQPKKTRHGHNYSEEHGAKAMHFECNALYIVV
jgi:hypothetical protein